MRKLASFLVILLILTAYGRCVADQFGALHVSNNACCQQVCDSAGHCEVGEDGDQDHPTPSDKNSPCQLCLIISSDSILQSDDVEAPTPTIIEIDPNLHRDSLIHLLTQQVKLLFSAPISPNPQDPPADDRSELRRIVVTTTPVRGPSLG